MAQTSRTRRVLAGRGLSRYSSAIAGSVNTELVEEYLVPHFRVAEQLRPANPDYSRFTSDRGAGLHFWLRVCDFGMFWTRFFGSVIWAGVCVLFVWSGSAGRGVWGRRPVVQVINRGMRESAMGMTAWAGQAVGRWILIIVFISTTWAAILMRRSLNVSN